MSDGFKAICVPNCNYFQLTNCKVAFSIGPEFGEFPKFLPGFKECCQNKFNNYPGCNLIQINKEGFLSHTDMKYYIFVKPSIDSCYCLSKYWITDEFDVEKDIQKEKEEEEKRQAEEQAAHNKAAPTDTDKDQIEAKNEPIQEEEKIETGKKKAKTLEVSKKGRKEAVKRREVYIDEGKLGNKAIEELNKITDKEYLSVVLRIQDPDFSDKELIDLIFSKKVVAVQFSFLDWTNQEFLDYIADKIEERNTSLFEITCNYNEYDRKGKHFLNPY